MRDKFIRFMQGRYGGSYGLDQLSRFLTGLCMALLAISLFSRLRIWFWLALAVLIYNYYRLFSKDLAKRYVENQKFLQATLGIRGKITKKKQELAQKKTHHIYRCPNCKQKIRVPRNRGKIEISCPKCGTKIVKKS